MIEILEYKSEHKRAWSEYIDKAPSATIAHRIEWRDIISGSLGHKPVYLLAKDSDNVRGVLPLFLVRTWWQSKYLVSIPWLDYGGVCADDQATAEQLLQRAQKLARKFRAGFVEHRSEQAVSGELPTRDDKVTFRLKLESDFEKIWKGFNAKLRNQIRKADKSGLTTYLGGLDFLDPFYEVFCHNMRDLGTPVWGRDLFERILLSLGPSAQIILVKSDDKVIAGGLLLVWRDQLYVPSASAYRSFLKYCPNHALYWRLIREGCENGYGYFDFGRSSIDSSTFNFKKQWQPSYTPLSWQYQLHRAQEIPSINPANPKYRLFINAWRRLPLKLANLIGPRIIRNFP